MEDWTSADDQLLRDALCDYGLKRWEKISHALDQRFSPAQCKARWVVHLNPLTAPRRAWTAADDAVLRETVALVDCVQAQRVARRSSQGAGG